MPDSSPVLPRAAVPSAHWPFAGAAADGQHVERAAAEIAEERGVPA